MSSTEPIRSTLARLLEPGSGSGSGSAPGSVRETPDVWHADTVRIATENGVAGLCWGSLEQQEELARLNPEQRAGLRAARDKEIALSIPFSDVVTKLLDSLSESQIPVIALKGLALRHALYDVLGWLRGPGDIDLMVPRARLEDARAAMQDIGLVATTRYGPEFYERHHHIEPHKLPEFPSVLVDVHWTPVALPHPYVIDLQQWWQRARPLEGGGEGVLRLDDADQALHLCLQLDHDDAYSGKARALFELAAWAQLSRLDGRTLAARARDMGGSDAVGRSYALAQRLFGAPPPAGVSPDPGPFGLRGSLWHAAVERSVWRDSERRPPAWYLQHCSRILAGPKAMPAALLDLMKPVFANPRLGGRGFESS